MGFKTADSVWKGMQIAGIAGIALIIVLRVVLKVLGVSFPHSDALRVSHVCLMLIISASVARIVHSLNNP